MANIVTDKNNTNEEIPKEDVLVTISQVNWPETLTEIEFVNQGLKDGCLDTVELPVNVETLNFSRNKLTYVPEAVTKLNQLKNLNLSYNFIEYFDDTPSFCHTIQELNLAKNNLLHPPCWVWVDQPHNLKYLNIRQNINITASITPEYLHCLKKCISLVNHLVIDNCKLGKLNILLQSFRNVTDLDIGHSDFNSFSINIIDEFPGKALEKCTEIQRINLSNTQIFTISPDIAIYKNLVQIDLSLNNISLLPNEFCSLNKLKVCNLSHNKLLYLPDRFTELIELVNLHLDNNELWVVPSMKEFTNLKLLDLYNNNLSEIPKDTEHAKEIDLAQNYFEEPTDSEYVCKKKLLRRGPNIFDGDRIDGNKTYTEAPESEHSKSTSDCDISITSKSDCEENCPCTPTSIEDWDSDEYWVPHFVPIHKPSQSPWMTYVRRMMRNNFCPMDLHEETIDKVNEGSLTEVPGQFDDLSDDDS